MLTQQEKGEQEAPFAGLADLVLSYEGFVGCKALRTSPKNWDHFRLCVRPGQIPMPQRFTYLVVVFADALDIVHDPREPPHSVCGLKSILDRINPRVLT